jgi:AmmeMemoRadiSam system protein A
MNRAAAAGGDIINAMNLSAGQQALVLDLARAFVRDGLLRTLFIPPGNLDPVLKTPAGCFVSLHSLQGHQLRGCVGRIDASAPLLDALRNAAEQVLRDPRFVAHPVRLEELADLSVEVSVLSAAVPIASAEEYHPREHGIFLSLGNHSGCFLPQVARETGWTREQLLDRLCTEKLGFPPLSWRNPQARLHVFTVQVIGPAPFVPGTGAGFLKTTH